MNHKGNNIMALLTAILFIVTGVMLFLLFRQFIVVPALARLPDGGRGEVSGIIGFLRFFVYGVCALQVFFGVVLLLIVKSSVNPDLLPGN